jgi:type IV secretory pathway VirB3-like protein
MVLTAFQLAIAAATDAGVVNTRQNAKSAYTWLERTIRDRARGAWRAASLLLVRLVL